MNTPENDTNAATGQRAQSVSGLVTGSGMAFYKGHGTQNDFVVIVDPDVNLDLTPQRVARIADRRAGLGADGVIRIATAETLLAKGVITPEEAKDSRSEEWFMDYRNADGSLAEMCGNGVRVFAHVLAISNLLHPTQISGAQFGIGTRAGRKLVTVEHFDACDSARADIAVDMGAPEVLGLSTGTLGDFSFAGLGVDMGNPHLAAIIPGLTAEELAGLPVADKAVWDEEFFPRGVNIEIATELTPCLPATPDGTASTAETLSAPIDGEIHMRVHERGVGETRSCGTGTVAAAVAALADAERETGTVRVFVPGGEVIVEVNEQTTILHGPSEIVAEGTSTL